MRHYRVLNLVFMKSRSTSNALMIIRRLQDICERSGTSGFFMFLDWEKAFDKLYQDKIFSALERFRVPPHLIQLIKDLYAEPSFFVEINNKQSKHYPQHRGIRQGCPLSPYLFIIVLAAVMQDVHSIIGQQHFDQPWGAITNEILFADDTVLMAKSARSLEQLLHVLERVASTYGLNLNKKKCVLLKFHSDSIVHFLNNLPVGESDNTIYLGSEIDIHNRGHNEINRRISQATYVWKKLGIFWKHSSCPLHTKLQIYDAVIRAKLAYGLETIVLNDGDKQKIDAFQLRGLRQILKIPTTFAQSIQGYNRTHTNEFVYQQANQIKFKHYEQQQITRPDGQPFRPIIPVSQYLYNKAKAYLGHIIRSPANDPVRRAVLKPGTAIPKLPEKMRVGRPCNHWIYYMFDNCIDDISSSFPSFFLSWFGGVELSNYNYSDEHIQAFFLQAANKYYI